MFAFFELGLGEIVVLGIILSLFAVLRPKGTWNREELARLRAEVERLSREVERLKKDADDYDGPSKPAKSSGSTGISEHPG